MTIGQRRRCLVMGVVNRTPDSFYDGGRMSLTECIAHASRLIDEGADLLDVGGVKAGPGPEVSEEEETARLLPLVEALAARSGTGLSVETARPSVARRALDAGATMINDVTASTADELLDAVAAADAAFVVMHHGGQIRGRPRHPRYSDVVAEVAGALQRLAVMAAGKGVAQKKVFIDPGLDFGKTTYHSLELVRRLDELVATGWPVLVAPSRKDVVGETLGLPLEDRLEGTLALVALSVAKGASIVRVHDVEAAARTVDMTLAVMGEIPPAAPLRGLWD